MTSTTYFRLLNGQPFVSPDPLDVRAGPLNLQYDSGSIRYIRYGDVEVVRQIYAAVRDQNWGTVPGRLNNLAIETTSESFHISFESLHQQSEIDFRWQGIIVGTSDGVIIFKFSGTAVSQFKRNRIGFCILHPMECAGKPVRIEQVDGQLVEDAFPEFIAPHQPFKNIRAIQHEFVPASWAEVRMEGDTFEMEDQRNWIDASFKTYCTPLAQPFPVEVLPGTQVEQTVTLRILEASQSIDTRDSDTPLRLEIGSHSYPLPKIGLGAASHDEPLNAMAVERLKRLGLSHLRVDVRPDQPDWLEHLRRISTEANEIDLPLEIVFHLGDDAENQLRTLQQHIQQLEIKVARWLIFRKGEPTTSAQWMELARTVLGSNVPIVGGTDAFFTELNRNRPDIDQMDGVVYSINPQVHAFDDASLVETLATQAVTVHSARQFSGETPIYVSPITLKMRWNPNATTPPPPASPDELPPQADARQMSLLGAGWTLGSVKYLTLGGAAGLTYFETTGYMGVMATERGSSIPDQFWNIPDGIYPVYHMLADIGEFAHGSLIPIFTSDHLRVDGFALQDQERLRILIANLTPQSQSVFLSTNDSFRLRRLDTGNAEWAMREPEQYRMQQREIVRGVDGNLSLELAPFAILRLDREQSS
jgi:D-apionolactonase